MSKIGKLFRALGALIRQPSLINRVLEDNERWKKRVQASYALPDGLPQVNLTDLLPGFEETVEPYSFLDGTSLITDLALLKGLARKTPGCVYLEIGTWRGESVANVASVARECVTVGLPDREMLEMGLPQRYIDMHRFFSEKLPNVTHIRHNSLTFDFDSLKKKFDLVFVDGDHHYASVKKDTEQVWKQLRSEEAVIVWHDYALNPETVRWEVLAGILDGLPDKAHGKLYHVSNTLCCIYTTLQLPTHPLEVNSRPAHFFSVNVKARKTGGAGS